LFEEKQFIIKNLLRKFSRFRTYFGKHFCKQQEVCLIRQLDLPNTL